MWLRRAKHASQVRDSPILHWDGAGLALLQSAIDHGVFRLIEEDSAAVLPRLVGEGETFDAVFIDGGHNFDNVFIDLHWAGRLLRPGGVIILDDLWMPSVRTALRFFETNLGWTSTTTREGPGKRFAIITLPDRPFARSWDHFVSFGIDTPASSHS